MTIHPSFDLSARTRDLAARLREDLAAAEFTVTVLESLWGPRAEAALGRGERIPAQRALAKRLTETDTRDPHRSAATLAELFVLAVPVASDRVALALPRLGLDGALELGLVAEEKSPDGVPTLAPRRDLRPYSFVDALGAGSWWITSDLSELALGRALDEDHVLGVGGATVTLAGLVLHSPAGSALDLGTGCGIQAMHASRYAERVVATDISHRALECAALNAALNGITSIEFRHGSLFDPVAGDTFDRIISNPPFVITPRADGVPSYEYRDGGLVGDGIMEAVVRGMAEHLRPGGVGQMLGNWEYSTGVHAFDRVREWSDSLDTWLIERDLQDPTEYAETWIRDGGTKPGTGQFDQMYNAWLDDFAERGVTQVGFGYLTVRMPPAGRASVPRLRRFERVTSARPERSEGSGGGLGTHIEQCLAAFDWQVTRTDADLEAAHLAVAPDVTEERHYWPGADDPTAMVVRQGGGFGRTIPVDTALAALVGACDGELSVGSIIEALAQLLEVDREALRAELLPRVREFVADSLLVPSPAP